ncbi:MAG TPA: hypothetical protein VFQ80_10015, partial [Thermomicrobiales bacterium]|nr:hypothetical protein [Thermomicrobiales bacterium]
MAEFATDDSGSFTVRFVAPDASSGRHVVRATVGEQSAAATLAVEAAPSAAAARAHPASKTGTKVAARGHHPARSQGRRASDSQRKQDNATARRTPAAKDRAKKSGAHHARHAAGGQSGPAATKPTPASRDDGAPRPAAARSHETGAGESARSSGIAKQKPKRRHASTNAGVSGLTFAPNADARVEQAHPTANYGSSSKLRVDGGSDPDVETYLRFPVSGVSG